MEIICPQCRKPYVQTVHGPGLLDRLLRHAYVHPHCCRICRHRFYAMRWGVHEAEAPVDGGQYRMRPVRIRAVLLDGGERREGTITGLSAGGCAIETSAPLLEGTLFGIQMDALDDEPPIAVEAAIIRTALDSRAEAEFLRLAKEEAERLDFYVTSLWLEGTQIARSSGRWKAEPLRTP